MVNGRPKPPHKNVATADGVENALNISRPSLYCTFCTTVVKKSSDDSKKEHLDPFHALEMRIVYKGLTLQSIIGKLVFQTQRQIETPIIFRTLSLAGPKPSLHFSASLQNLRKKKCKF